MAFEIVMPQLGLSMDRGQIVAWLKDEGDAVKAGDLLLTVESDKSTVDVEAVEAGTLHILRKPADGAIDVGEVIALLLGEEESLSGEIAESAASAARDGGEELAKPPARPSMEGDRATKAQNGRATKMRRKPSTPAARRRADELSVDWRLATPTGPSGAIKERDVVRLAEESARAVGSGTTISPIASRFAEAVGLTAAALRQRYPGQRIERAHVEAYLREALQDGEMQPQEPSAPGKRKKPELTRREPIGRLRRVIRDRMVQSVQTYAPVTLTTEGDASELVRIRTALKESLNLEVLPSYNIFLAKLVARALLEHPHLNATLEDEEIIYWPSVNIGLAVETGRGLVVPVLRDVTGKSIQELAIEFSELSTRAKEALALPDDLTGGTFTITNLGLYNIDAFTPIINPPESAILGVGRLIDKWVVVNREPAIRTMLSLSLTFDHRLVDGAPAARFLDRIKQLIEHPYLWWV